MPPDRGRASKACTACRRQKTRCYETTAGRACLRCDRLGQECSLLTKIATHDASHIEGLANSAHFNGETVSDIVQDERYHKQQKANRYLKSDRIERLERLVAALARRLDDVESVIPRQNQTDQNIITPIGQERSYVRPELDEGKNGRPPAPLFVLREVSNQSGIRPTDRTSSNTPSRALSNDIIIKGLLSEQEATSLLLLFQENYGRWVSFSPTTPIARLLEDVRKSPLLLAACCLIAVRHTSQEMASRLAPKLFKEAKSMLSLGMLNVPQPIEFFQASLVLSLWSTTIAQLPLGIDSWLLSGFALQHSAASSFFLISPRESRTHLQKEELDHLCIWNHLCLVHLHYCVGTRRKAVLDQKDVDRCRLILGSDHATNFESRMVAEVHLYWIMYESCATSVGLPKTQEALHSWKDEWGFLLDQPQSQFVQMGFYFAQLLVYDQSLKSRSAAVRESLLSEMVRLSTSIINLAMDTTDEQTEHLSDHIYHTISFAAVTLARLLHNHEEQLSSSHDLNSLDGLILSLVSWLRAIGLPCHVAHTMGDVVAASHKKLRPDYGPSPSTSYTAVDPAIQDDFAQLFPEFYGTWPFDMVHGSMLPDFQPIL